MATYGTESSTLHKGIANSWLLLKERFLRRIFEGINVNENWRKRYNRELIQMFGDLGTLSCVRISRLEWTGHVNRIYSKSKLKYLTIILRRVD